MPEIIFEDNHLLITVKPPNQLTQGDETGDLSLLDECKQYIKESKGKTGEVYLGLVHRLDRPVGGIVVFGRTSKAASRLSEQLRSHEMHRDYLCVVESGETLPDNGRLIHYLQKNKETGMVVAVKKCPESQEAILNYWVLGRKNGTALVHVVLETGRKHQIRVQMATIGHPILYDMRYGHGLTGHSVSLWGASLTLIHPTKKQKCRYFSVPKGGAFALYPKEIDKWLQMMQEEKR